MTLPDRPLRFLVALGAPDDLERHAPVLRELSGRGHLVDLAFVTAGRIASPLAHRLADEFPQLTLRRAHKAGDRNLSNLRAGLGEGGYLTGQRALGMEVVAARRLPRRSSRDGWAPAVLGNACEAISGRVIWASPARWMSDRLHDAARAIDADPTIVSWLRRLDVDAYLCAPFRSPDARELELLCAATAAGLPTALLVGELDQLSLPGRANSSIDRVLAWNDWQRDLATTRHRVPAEHVAVLGAPPSDAWYAPPEEPIVAPRFRTGAGLSAELPYVVVLSSPNVDAEEEFALVRALGAELAGRAGILVRPLSGASDRWESMPGTGPTPVSAWPSEIDGRPATLRDAAPLLLGVVAMEATELLEPAVLGLACFAIAPTSPDELLEAVLSDRAGGPICVVPWVTGLWRQLPERPGADAASSRRADAIVRPHGRELAVAPLVADELERLVVLGTTPPQVKPPRPATRGALATATVLSSGSPRRAAIRRLQAWRGGPDLQSVTQSQRDTVVFDPWPGDPFDELLYWIPWVRGQIADRGRDEHLLVAYPRDPRWYGAMGGAEVIDHAEFKQIPKDDRADRINGKRVAAVVAAYRSGASGLNTVSTWGGARRIRVEATTHEGVVAITGSGPHGPLRNLAEAVELALKPSTGYVPGDADWAALTDLVGSASLACVTDLAPAALAVSLGVDTVLLFDGGPPEAEADIDVLDRIAAALDVELTVMTSEAAVLLAGERPLSYSSPG